MKNKSEILVGYRPRVSVYPKTHARGRVDFYVSYYLPRVKRKVARPLYCKKSEAKELMFINERRLRITNLMILISKGFQRSINSN